jgi:hypothetical protein
MVGGTNARGSVGGGSVSGVLFPPGPSETDGETDNFTDDFGEHDEWDYSELLATLYVRNLAPRLSWSSMPLADADRNFSSRGPSVQLKANEDVRPAAVPHRGGGSVRDVGRIRALRPQLESV